MIPLVDFSLSKTIPRSASMGSHMISAVARALTPSRGFRRSLFPLPPAHPSTTFSTMVPLLPILLLLPLLASASSLVLYPDSTTLPFAVHVPDTAQPPYPAILFLSGNGSLGDVADLGTLTMWDGVGLMISLYLSGNTTAAPQAAGEDWLTILPLGPVGM